MMNVVQNCTVIGVVGRSIFNWSCNWFTFWAVEWFTAWKLICFDLSSQKFFILIFSHMFWSTISSNFYVKVYFRSSLKKKSNFSLKWSIFPSIICNFIFCWNSLQVLNDFFFIFQLFADKLQCFDHFCYNNFPQFLLNLNLSPNFSQKCIFSLFIPISFQFIRYFSESNQSIPIFHSISPSDYANSGFLLPIFLLNFKNFFFFIEFPKKLIFQQTNCFFSRNLFLRHSFRCTLSKMPINCSEALKCVCFQIETTTTKKIARFLQ